MKFHPASVSYFNLVPGTVLNSTFFKRHQRNLYNIVLFDERMYVWMVIIFSRSGIKWYEWLPILLVVSITGNLVSRDGFGRPVPREPAHSPRPQAESGVYSRYFSHFPWWRHSPFIYTVNRNRISPEFIRSSNYLPMTLTHVLNQVAAEIPGKVGKLCLREKGIDMIGRDCYDRDW